MYQHILDAVTGELSGALALRRVSEIIGFHRITASPGFRDAAGHCARRLEETGLQVETLSFPADGQTRYWGSVIPEEWHCRSAELELVAPEGDKRRLTSFAENPVSLIQRSGGTPPEGVTAALVVVDDPDRPESYEGVDVAGKVILAAGDLARVRRLAVEERGALGIVTDQVTESPLTRPAMDLPGARQYHSFWWRREEKKCFGFVVSPREGLKLRRLCRDASANGKEAPKIRARVDAAFYPGSVEVVSALLPGKGKEQEEILVVAHLCHPQPSANDNASGAGLAMEVARTLGALVHAGKLPTPERSIRFLLVPEMAGTYAFLSSRGETLERCVAALNLDMVGQDQDKCGSTLQVEHPPRAMPSFTGDLLAEIMEEVAAGASNLAGTARLSTFRWALAPFSGGSDHYILSDPSVGIACPMLIQWPDRFYHTDMDTLDKVDPGMLAVVGRLAATYAYFLASAGSRQAAWLAHRMVARLASRLAGAIRDMTTSDRRSNYTMLRLRFLRDRCVEDLGALRRLSQTQEEVDLEQVLEACRQDAGRITDVYLEIARRQTGLDGGDENASRDAKEEPRLAVVHRRLVKGPVALRFFTHQLPEELRGRWETMNRERRKGALLITHALYWMDGRNSLSRMAELVELETGFRDDEFLLCYVDVLESLGFLSTV